MAKVRHFTTDRLKNGGRPKSESSELNGTNTNSNTLEGVEYGSLECDWLFESFGDVVELGCGRGRRRGIFQA